MRVDRFPGFHGAASMTTHDELNVAPDAPLGPWPDGTLPAEPNLGLHNFHSRDKALATAPRTIELPAAARQLRVLGVPITDMPFDAAVGFVSALLEDEPPGPRTLYYVNAHTLNLAYENPTYRAVLDRADYVLGDGTGVRWAAWRQGVRLQDNLNGTDLVPAVLEHNAERRFRFYMLGTTAEVMERVCPRSAARFPAGSWPATITAFLNETNEAGVIAEINRCRPHLLLVAMGNPLQEIWIDRNRQRLQGPVVHGRGRAGRPLGRRSDPGPPVGPPVGLRVARHSAPATAQVAARTCWATRSSCIASAAAAASRHGLIENVAPRDRPLHANAQAAKIESGPGRLTLQFGDDAFRGKRARKRQFVGLQPTKLSLDAEGQLVIDWNDGEPPHVQGRAHCGQRAPAPRAAKSARSLRLRCPCCRCSRRPKPGR